IAVDSGDIFTYVVELLATLTHRSVSSQSLVGASRASRSSERVSVHFLLSCAWWSLLVVCQQTQEELTPSLVSSHHPNLTGGLVFGFQRVAVEPATPNRLCLNPASHESGLQGCTCQIPGVPGPAYHSSCPVFRKTNSPEQTRTAHWSSP
ncbi:hypothetical protein PGTUg99_000190, partial [Puccinia graminis f. sp. tritici]